jgi:thiamine kinase-like enzyme
MEMSQYRTVIDSDRRVPADRLGRVLARLELLVGSVISIERLSGGLTNENYRVRTSSADLVVRIAPETSGLLAIDRVNEYENSIAAAEVGVGAPVVDHMEDPYVLVIEHLEGRTLSAKDLRECDCLERVAQACRVLHRARRFRNDFNMFAVQQGYLRLVLERGFRLPKGYLDFDDRIAVIRKAMSERPEKLVPCNNDLLAENFIDDGERVRIIDYEYSGNNEPSFELGNIWSESNLSREQLESLVAYYYGLSGAALREKVARARLWGLMSKYGWTLWASIQASVAQIDFDFWSWGMEKYDRAVAELEGPDLDGLLQDVAMSGSRL